MSINRRRVLEYILAGVSLSGSRYPAEAAAQPPVPQPAAARRPNIVWISAEDLSPDLGCYGDSYAITPALDRLAAEGVRFTRAFAAAPVCSASRSAIITGMYPTAIGTMHHRSLAVPPPQVRCFTEYLRAAGYYCTNNAKTDYNFPAPLTAWDQNSNSAHWRNRPEPEQPFFAVFNLTTTHEGQIRLPDSEFAEVTRFLSPEERHDPAKATLPPYYPDTPRVRQDWARYHDLITRMDRQVDALLKELEDAGLRESTIVFFWGDHGRGLPRAKRWVYDSGLQVPLLVRWPGYLAPGSVDGRLISLVDLAPTVLSLTGVPVPESLQGQAFLGKAQGKKPRSYIFAHRDRMDETYDRIRAVRDRRYKYIRNYQPQKPYAQHIAYAEEMPTLQELRRLHKEEATLLGQGKIPDRLTPIQRLFLAPEKPEEELYDTEADPHEVRNLATDPALKGEVRRLRGALERWIKETRDQGFLPESRLLEEWRPDGQSRKTEDPLVGVTENPGEYIITLSCRTPGASLAYTLDPVEQGDPRWLLYTAPLSLSRAELSRAGRLILRVQAVRPGYLPSSEIDVTLGVGQ